ncbi:5-formyltetrahydrofolate cyclo-ligase [Halosquirtibacter xylanolyticus]|uniref:5-formyltetrahydrofolate cyclo-ligase n=1 Tax=Halosquirtibacter xylanolyticus TaxID=3374599 RepID=UPI00374803FD|nr:5-formyltetrahydrofolate cyclo-ligase [Prolixibacteraceae bacterium]
MKLDIALIQCEPTLGDLDANREKISTWLDKIPDHVDIILLPELANSGYHFIDEKQAERSSEEISQSGLVNDLKAYAQSNDVAIAIGLAEQKDGIRYNSALWITPQGVEVTYRKAHLFARENLFFNAGKEACPIVTWKGARIGLMICYDWTFPEVWQWMAQGQVDLVCHLCNLVMPHAQQMVKTYAFSNHFYIAQSNRVGTERDLTFTGASSIIAPDAEVLVHASKTEEEIIIGTIDTDYSRDKQLNPYNHKTRDTRRDIYPRSYKEDKVNLEMLRQEKRQLRKYIKQNWANIPPKELHDKSKAVLDKLESMKEFIDAKKVLLYWSLKDEVYTHDFVRKYAKTKDIYLPVMKGAELDLAKYTSDENLDNDNPFGIFEPSNEILLDNNELDLIIIPGVAFDRQGGRLGRGKGFYDRLLQQCNTKTIGIGLDFQLVWSIPKEKHDQLLSMIITNA